MKLLRFLLILLAQITTLATLHAEPFMPLKSENALSNRRVFGSVMDADGYLWFATRTSMERFNGESYTTYRLRTTSEHTPFMVYPKGVSLDNKNNIYAYGDKDILKYSPTEDKFISVDFALDNFEKMDCLAFDVYNNMWIGTSKNLYRVSCEDGTCEKVHDTRAIYDIVFDDKSNTGYVATSRGVLKLKRQVDGGYLCTPLSISPAINKSRVQSLHYDPLTKHLWIGSFTSGIYLYDVKQREASLIQELSHPVRSITAVEDNSLWCGVDGMGIYAYNRFTFDLENQYSQSAKSENHIAGNNIYSIDDYGNYTVICSFTDGILVYNKNQLQGRSYKNIRDNRNSPANSHINCILEDTKGRIWIGSNDGVSRLNPKNGEWHHFMQNRKGVSTTIMALEQDTDGNIWASGYASDLVRIDKEDKVERIFIPSEEKPTQHRKEYIFNIHQDVDSNIWLAGIINNLTCYNPTTKEIKDYPLRGIYQIVELNDSTLLFATLRGVSSFDKSSGKTTSLNNKMGLPKRCAVQVLHICPKQPNLLWIGTEGVGATCYDFESGTHTLYNTSNGLSSNDVCSIGHDKLDRVWLSTENGLNCLDTNTQNITIFSKQDGLPSNIFTLRTYSALKDNTLIFGTTEGAFKFDPMQFNKDDERKPNLRFEEFTLFNSKVLPSSDASPLNNTIDKSDHIELKYDQHSFSFSFNNVGDVNAGQSNYSWKLEGFDKEWSAPSHNNRAIYTNIPPGEYTFRVKLYSPGSDTSSQERQIAIKIGKPWYAAWYSIIAYFAIALLLLYMLFKIKENRMVAEYSDQKIRFFINIAHDIRTPLTLIKAPLAELESENLSPNGRNAMQLAKNNIDKLLNIVTQLLDFQKVEREAMTLHVEKSDVQSFITTTVGNFQPVAKEKHISLKLNFAEGQSYGYIDQRKVQVIIDNLLSNAIKYTNTNGNIEVGCTIGEKELSITISDDGIGIAQREQKQLFNRFYRAENAENSNETGSGIGLLLTKKMIMLHKGKISFTSKEGIGTNFYVTLPIDDQSYSSDEISTRIVAISTTEEEAEKNTTESASTKILIVEDNDELRSYLAKYLSKSYNVIESSNGEEALEMTSQENPDFIISDVMMPKLSGTELCKRLKSNIETCHIPVVLLTSLAEREDIINGLEAGADDYITKPFDPSVVKHKIASIINNRVLYRKKYVDKSAFSDNNNIVGDMDQRFMERIIELVESKMMNSDFSIDSLATEMNVSRSVLFKKIKSLTATSPHNFVRDIKMKRAATLLTENNYSIEEIAYLTGYPNAKYFSTAFKQYYGTAPSKYLSQIEEQS